MDEKNSGPNRGTQPGQQSDPYNLSKTPHMEGQQGQPVPNRSNGYSNQQFNNQSNGNAYQNPDNAYSENQPNYQNNMYQNPNEPVNQFNYNGWNPNVNPNFVRNEPNGYAIASLILGILSVINVFCYGIVGAILGIIAIVLACISKPKEGPFANKFSGMALGGFITGIIGLILGLLVFISFLVVLGQSADTIDSIWSWESEFSMITNLF